MIGKLPCPFPRQTFQKAPKAMGIGFPVRLFNGFHPPLTRRLGNSRGDLLSNLRESSVIRVCLSPLVAFPDESACFIIKAWVKVLDVAGGNEARRSTLENTPPRFFALGAKSTWSKRKSRTIHKCHQNVGPSVCLSTLREKK